MGEKSIDKKFVILAADDEMELLDALQLFVEREGMELIKTDNGISALALFEKHQPDLVLLDYDKILGLGLGADDYITKPYNPLEVVARIKAQLRRCYDYQETDRRQSNVLTGCGLELNLSEGTLKKDGQEISLTKTEFRILELFMKTPGRIYTKQQIFDHSWDEPYMEDDSTVMVHISNLRNKIENDPKKPAMIRTIKGLGYKFEKEK